MPQLTFMWLMTDHTTGSGVPDPVAQVADNDLAVGRVVDAISHSKFWKNTAIFVDEDDTQNGVDHVDGHRGADDRDQPVLEAAASTTSTTRSSTWSRRSSRSSASTR